MHAIKKQTAETTAAVQAEAWPPPPPHHAELEDALGRLGRGGRWLRTLFLLGCIPGVLNALHLVSYVFLAVEPEHWCGLPKNVLTGWSSQQKRNFSSGVQESSSSCSYLAWNYSALAGVTHAAALQQTEGLPRPPELPCTSHVFLEREPGSSIVSEWSLVCDHAALRSTAQVALALGKILGSLLFGCISDRMGRKTSFVAASLLYLVTGPAAAFSFHYSAFLLFRAALGAAGSGAFNAALTILTEAAHPLKRPTLGILFNLSYPIGFLALPVVALVLPGWRPLQLAISLPALLLVLPCWFLPESPRWLITQGRTREALHVVHHASPREMLRHNSVLIGRSHLEEEEEEEEPEQQAQGSCWVGTGAFLQGLSGLLRHKELRRRLLLLYACWFSCALTYHSLALSAATLLQQPHRYVALLGAVELPAYLLPLLLLRHIGRRASSSLLLLGSAAALLSLLAIPPAWTGGVLAAAMVGRLCTSAATSVVVLYTTELFPTVARNTAIGTCTTMAQLGAIAAPYLVDLLGTRSAHIPSSICGVVAAFASIFALGLPETRDLPLCDTVEQVVTGRCDACSD